MPHDEERVASTSNTEIERLEATVRQLILMRETGPKSSAWHRARIHTIWRLQRAIAAAEAGPHPDSDAIEDRAEDAVD